MHSHHSHSGDYVSHAVDPLEDMVLKAISMKFETFCLTEHQPRLSNDYLYPEETEKNYTTKELHQNFVDFYSHAKKIQKRYQNDDSVKTKFLVGFEVEAIDDQHIQAANDIQNQYDLDLCVGSVHFVKHLPIDFDEELWIKALNACGGVYELFDEYFELQYKMLTGLKPLVVGHFDLIFLKCPDDLVDPNTGKKVKSELSIEQDWPEVWEKIMRNIQFVKSYGGLFELNSASLRKGWETPYPRPEFAKAICNYGGARFCLSDDSHSVSQVGLNYHRVLDYVKALGLQKLYCLDFGGVVKSVLIEEVQKSSFWQ